MFRISQLQAAQSCASSCNNPFSVKSCMYSFPSLHRHGRCFAKVSTEAESFAKNTIFVRVEGYAWGYGRFGAIL